MPLFRKRPIIVEAFQWFPSKLAVTSDWWQLALDTPHDQIGSVTEHGTFGGDQAHLLIFTLEGVHRANAGDWIIRGVYGEIYPCKPEIFSFTYEPI